MRFELLSGELATHLTGRSKEIERDGYKMKVQPVYEWCGELGI